MVLMICAVVIYKRMDLEKEYNKKLQQKEVLYAQLEDEQFETKELENKKAYMKTKKYIEDVARDVLGLVYEDEVLFKESDDN